MNTRSGFDKKVNHKHENEASGSKIKHENKVKPDIECGL